MSTVRNIRPLDAVIAAIAVVVLVLGAYLGYSVWAQGRQIVDSTPAARAVAAVEARVRKNPNDIDARMQLAQALAVAGRDKDAVVQYEAALKISKDFAPAISGIGFLALQRKQFAEGEKYFRRVIAILEPKHKSGPDAQLEIAYFYLGTALMEQKEYEEAANYYKKAILLRRDASDTHYALAFTYNKLGSDSKYREELENTLLFDPKMPEANYDYALLLLKDGDKAAAAEHLRTSITAAPNVDLPQDALEELGPFSDRLAAAKTKAAKDPKAALIEARIAVALEPQNVEALILLGDLAVKTGAKKHAAEMYQRVLVIEPNNASAKAGLEKVNNGK